MPRLVPYILYYEIEVKRPIDKYLKENISSTIISISPYIAIIALIISSFSIYLVLFKFKNFFSKIK